MSDAFQELFAQYATAEHHLSGETMHEVERRVLDTLGVMCAAINGDAPRAARMYARTFPFEKGATVFGTDIHSTPEIAGFANGVHARYLDYNDTYLSLEPLHPSDVIMPLLALAETQNLRGAELVAAIAVAYEIEVNLCDAASLRAHGWDHVNYIGLATAAGAARLLQLDASRAAQAISIAIIPHAAMRQTRSGELSMWKGAAAAHSARNGLFAALAARAGLTGPSQPFVGKMGMISQLLGGEHFRDQAFAAMGRGDPPRRICDAYIKKYPVEYHAQSAVDVATALHHQVMDPSTITEIEIETFGAAYAIIVDDPEKWRPTTRETADHSLQYIVCAALLDGQVTQDTFSAERLRDRRIADLLAKTQVKDSPTLSALYPESIPVKVKVETFDGHIYSGESRYPRGHAGNRMNDDEVTAKFEMNTAAVLDNSSSAALQTTTWSLDKLENLRELTALWPHGNQKRV